MTDSKQREYLDHISQSSTSLLSIIDGILDLVVRFLLLKMPEGRFQYCRKYDQVGFQLHQEARLLQTYF